MTQGERMSEVTISAGEAARRLGVSPITIQRWVDKGVLNAERTPGGHRRIYVTELRRLMAANRPERPTGPIADWLDVLRAGDAVRVKAALLSAKQKYAGWAPVADEVASAIAELGRDWEAGQSHIFQERIATETLRRGLALCLAELRNDREAPRAVLFTVEGERHVVGLALAELVLAHEGWQCLWLGDGPPAEELQPIVDQLKPDLLVISASSCTPSKTIESYQTELKRAAEKNSIALALGGSGAWVVDPSVHRLVTFKDLHSALADWGRPRTSA